MRIITVLLLVLFGSGNASAKIVDHYDLGGWSYASEIIETAEGHLYVAGMAEKSDKYHLVVRKSTDGAKTWDTVLKRSGEYYYDAVFDMEMHPNGDIYLLAQQHINDENCKIEVLKSQDKGLNWVIELEKTMGVFCSAKMTFNSAGDAYYVFSTYEDNANNETQALLTIAYKNKQGQLVEDQIFQGDKGQIRVTDIIFDKKNKMYISARLSKSYYETSWRIYGSSSGSNRSYYISDEFLMRSSRAQLQLGNGPTFLIPHSSGQIMAAGHMPFKTDRKNGTAWFFRLLEPLTTYWKTIGTFGLETPKTFTVTGHCYDEANDRLETLGSEYQYTTIQGQLVYHAVSQTGGFQRPFGPFKKFPGVNNLQANLNDCVISKDTVYQAGSYVSKLSQHNSWIVRAVP